MRFGLSVQSWSCAGGLGGCLGAMMCGAKPLHVADAVVVASVDVVALRAGCWAARAGRVVVLALVAGPASDPGAAGMPVAG